MLWEMKMCIHNKKSVFGDVIDASFKLLWKRGVWAELRPETAWRNGRILCVVCITLPDTMGRNRHTFSGNDYGGEAMWGEISGSEHSLSGTTTLPGHLSTRTCNSMASGIALWRRLTMARMIRLRVLCGRSYGNAIGLNLPPDRKTPKLSYQKMQNENIYHHGTYNWFL